MFYKLSFRGSARCLHTLHIRNPHFTGYRVISDKGSASTETRDEKKNPGYFAFHSCHCAQSLSSETQGPETEPQMSQQLS